MGLFRSGQRHRHRSTTFRTHLSDVPATAHHQRVPGHGHRLGHLPKDRGTPRRKYLGGNAARKRIYVFVYDSEGGVGEEKKSKIIEIMLVEDNLDVVRLNLKDLPY